MVDATATAMKLKFPAFALIDDAVLEFALEEARLFIGSFSGVGRDLAVMYLAAHFLAVDAASSDDNGRQITAESIGRISTTYAQSRDPATGVGDLTTTFYGNRYRQLINIGNPKFKSVRMSHGRHHVL